LNTLSKKGEEEKDKPRSLIGRGEEKGERSSRSSSQRKGDPVHRGPKGRRSIQNGRGGEEKQAQKKGKKRGILV